MGNLWHKFVVWLFHIYLCRKALNHFSHEPQRRWVPLRPEANTIQGSHHGNLAIKFDWLIKVIELIVTDLPTVTIYHIISDLKYYPR